MVAVHPALGICYVTGTVDGKIPGMRRVRAYFVSHIAYWRRIRKHVLFRVAAGLWAFFGFVSLILPFFPHAEDWFYSLGYLPKWPWYVWAIGLFSLALIATVEASRSEMERLNQQLGDARRPEHTGTSLADLYSERKRVQGELEALETKPEPPDVPTLAALPMRMRTLRDDWRAGELARKIDQKKNELRLIDDLLRGSTAPQTEAPPPAGPNVVVEYRFSRDEFNRTGDEPFVLRNISQADVAKNVRVLPLKVGDLTATFEPDIIPFIEALGTKEVKMSIAGVFPPLRNTVPVLFDRKYRNENTDQLFVPQLHNLVIEYEDATNSRSFETSVTLRYTRYQSQITVGETKRRVKPSH